MDYNRIYHLSNMAKSTYIWEIENFVAVIPIEMSVIFRASGITNSYIIAVSSDDGKTWYYIDGSTEEELLEKEAHPYMNF